MKRTLLSIFLTLSLTLAGLAQTVTSVGTDFWIAFPPNTFLAQTIQLFIASDVATSGSLYSAYPGITQNFTVVPGIVTQISLPYGVQLSGGLENKGIEITTNDPVSVYGLNYFSNSTDAFLALPVNALGTDYRIVTFETDQLNFPSAFSVVATQDGTSLTIFNHQTNSTTNVNLNQGQTWLVEATGLYEDVTGSRIQSNFPVAVFGSVKEVNIPIVSCGNADYIVEMMFPHNSWGKNFATVALAGRDNSGDVFRVMAGDDGTDIAVNGITVSTINSGDHYDTTLAGYNSITASKAVLLAQFAKGMYCSGGITGDPLMMLIPPREQFLTNYTVVNVSGFDTHWINVVAPQEALGTILQDGVLIPNSAFTQIGTTNFYGAQRSVTAGTHTFSSTFPFGVFVYGWGYINSYGYPGGCSLSPVETVKNVTLSPSTATGILDVSTLCFTAHVTDDLNNPVAGVLVTFHISGISNITGTAYTNTLGDAQYCYARTGTTTGTDNIFAECFGINSTISTANWILNCINPTSAGTIGADQQGCGSFTPASLTSLTLPSGETGNLEYKWQQSIISNSSGFTDIAGSNSASYNPGIINQTTWYKRLARVDCMPDWTGAAESNVLQLTVITPLPVILTISASNNNICSGTLVTFTATPANGGLAPVYVWKVNGNVAGTNNPIYTYAPANGDVVTCMLTSSETCTSNNPATSNMVSMTVNPDYLVGVSIIASASQGCQGTSVQFTASPVNGGATPAFQWKVNGANAGTNSSVFTYTPANNDVVTCVLTSSYTACTTNNPATSNAIAMTINPNYAVDVSIGASANPVCLGTSVQFTASPVNGGSTPAFQWKVNGSNAGTNSPVFNYTPADNDVVSCILTSSYPACTTNNPATSNTLTMTVINNLTAVVSISATPNPFCSGNTVNCSATPINGGLTPVYQWKVNGVNAGTNASTYSFVPQQGDIVQCVMNSSLSCIMNNPVTSNTIVMNALAAPSVSFTLCFDSITTINAAAFRLKGGVPIGGVYSGPGVNSSTGMFTPSAAGVGTKTITYVYQNSFSCANSKTKTIIVQAAPTFNCGQNLTDIRDNKVYPTVQLGSQCWMQKNLNFGNPIQGATEQSDNCLNEKYCYNDNAANCSLYGGLYLWDELMAYTNTPGAQGLCPPGWHIPIQSEWNTLFTLYQNQALAGKPLQDSIFNGFRAKESGIDYSNISWKFQGFATIYWTSNSYGSIKALSHGMNLQNFSVSDYYSNRSNAFAVRCVKD